MNNIENMVSALEKISADISKEEQELSTALDICKLRKIDFSKAIANIQSQIRSAEEKFTIAFVGTFKTGKSTIINSLLNLRGEEKLSSEYDPDTAKCIKIIYRTQEDYEAEIDFGGKYPTERTSWAEAKKYTSQVALDKSDSSIAERAMFVKEVRYYVRNDLLRLCNILDLPGTGTGNYLEHTEITDEKILETDYFFWVVSTLEEPEKETIRNLQKIQHKLLPIINVWQKEAEGISTSPDLLPEKIIDILQSEYADYLKNAEEFIVYYAGEIDYAQEHNLPIKEEWGKEQFVSTVERLLNNIQDGDRGRRIRRNVIRALEECQEKLDELECLPELTSFKKAASSDNSEADRLLKKLRKCRDLARSEIEVQAQKSADEILSFLSDATESFVLIKMDGINFKALFQKQKYMEQLKEEYNEDYIKIDSGWVEKYAKTFSDNVSALLIGLYAEYEQEFDDVIAGQAIQADTLRMDFTRDITDAVHKDMVERLIPVLLGAVTTIVAARFIPGGVFMDHLAAIIAGGSGTASVTSNDRIKARAQTIANHCKIQIRHHKVQVLAELSERGNAVNNEFYDRVNANLSTKKEDAKGRMVQFDALLRKMEDTRSFLNMQREEVDVMFAD